MRIKVLREDGRAETLTLTGEWRCIEGQHLHRLVRDGFEHFFTRDGLYDGWGGAVSASSALADEMIDAVEATRDIKD